MKIFWSCPILVSIFLFLVPALIVGSSESTTTTTSTITPDVKPVNGGGGDNDDDVDMTNTNANSTNLVPTAEKLVRLPRHPPITVIKHVIRSSSKRSKLPRRRIKRPKIRYGAPPPYIYEDHQSSYYKPHYTPSRIEPDPEPVPAPVPEPEITSFSSHEFSGLNLNAADFDLPSTSYEAQSMDFDFYGGQIEEKNPFQSATKDHAPSSEYSSSISGGHEFESSVEPTYSYKSFSRKPHQKYGVPKNIEYSTDFNSHDSSFYSSPSDFSHYNTNYQPETESSSHARYKNPTITTSFAELPNEQYNNAFHKNQPSSYFIESSRPSGYDIYSNSEFAQNYDEHRESVPMLPPNLPPPQLPKSKSPHRTHPTQSTSDIEITYSPPYDTNLPSPKHEHTNGNNIRQYESIDPHITQPGNFAEPPAEHPPILNYDSSQDVHHAPAAPGSGTVDYVSPTQELPLSPYHKPPAYDFPKSSYEVPIYDPIPFEASTNDEQEYYPPNQYEPGALPTPSPTPPPTVQSHQNNFEPNFDLEPQHHQPQSHGNEFPKDTHTSETHASTTSTSTIKLQGQRKRPRRPLSISSTKHILDVPELKEAFEAARPTRYALHSTINADTEVNASTYVEKNHENMKATKTTENYLSPKWNPMRIRTHPHQIPAAIQSVKATSISTQSNNKSAYAKQGTKTYFKPRLRPISATMSTHHISSSSTATESSNISIEKSKSESFYDGTLAPSTLTMSYIYNSQMDKFKIPTGRQPLAALPKLSAITTALPVTQKPSRNITNVKRTTKSIIDTTLFKVPQNNDRGGAASDDLSQHTRLVLPKNHKLY